MHYLLFYSVEPDFIDRRITCRTEHVRLAWEAFERGELIQAGSLADPVDGAVLLFQGDSAAVAEGFAAADPYVRNGLVSRWVVRQWNTGLGPDAAVPVPRDHS